MLETAAGEYGMVLWWWLGTIRYYNNPNSSEFFPIINLFY